MTKLDAATKAAIGRMREVFGIVAAANVALVLAGMRPGYRFDEKPKNFTEDGDFEDPAFNKRLLAAYAKNAKDLESFIKTHFKGRLALLQYGNEPVVYRPRVVSHADLETIARTRFDSGKGPLAAFARILNFTGTSFPCTKRGTVMVSWRMVDGDGRTHYLSTHCARPAEVYPCIQEFAAMVKRAKDVIGVNLGGFKIAELFMTFDHDSSIVVKSSTTAP